MVLVLTFIKMPDGEQWAALRRMNKLLIVCYGTMSISNFITAMCGISGAADPAMCVSMLAVSMYQAMLFTATCVAFVAPQKISVGWLTKNGIGITIVVAVMVTCLFYGGKFFEACLWAGIVVYVISLVYYCLLFKRSYEQSLKLLEISYDEDMRGDLRFVKNCFLGALSVGISALVFVVFRLGNLCYSIFTCLYTLYYIYLAICVINYRIRAGYILKVVTTDKAPEEPAEEVVENIPEDSAQVAENELAEALERWVDKKYYTRNDLTVEEIAAELGTTQVMLRWYFTNRVGTTFRTWRQSLRLTEAKRVLRYEDVPTSTVHILAGVADKSNFHKLFRLEVGMTPQEYRDKYNTLPGHQEESQDL